MHVMRVNLPGFNATVSSPRGQLALHAWDSEGVRGLQPSAFDDAREAAGVGDSDQTHSAQALWHRGRGQAIDFQDRGAASTLLKHGLRPRCHQQRQGFAAVVSMLAWRRGRPRHPALRHWGCGRRVAVALWGGGHPARGSGGVALSCCLQAKLWVTLLMW